MKIAIHQPNFLPWYPYFQKIEQADKFVLLGNCQFEKNNFQNRFHIDNIWYTMSTRKGNRPINTKEYILPEGDWNKIKSKLPQYKDTLDSLDECISSDLFLTNVCIIKTLAKMLKCNTEILLDYPTELKSTERLVDICLHYGATEYISGQGAREYLDLELFNKHNITVSFQQDTRKVQTLEVIQNG
tara:strand:- start:968 stop:1525 length:558 start_codon:yes stop_codon:yes gene_type:complete